jgi:hypothetical protein
MIAPYAAPSERIDSDDMKGGRYSFVKRGSVRTYTSLLSFYYVLRFTFYAFTYHVSRILLQTVLVIYCLKCHYNPGQPELF